MNAGHAPLSRHKRICVVHLPVISDATLPSFPCMDAGVGVNLIIMISHQAACIFGKDGPIRITIRGIQGPILAAPHIHDDGVPLPTPSVNFDDAVIELVVKLHSEGVIVDNLKLMGTDRHPHTPRAAVVQIPRHNLYPDLRQVGAVSLNRFGWGNVGGKQTR